MNVIYANWCQTRFSFQMMFVSFNSNTTGVTSGAGTTYPSGAPEFTPIFSGVPVPLSLVFYVVLGRLLFVHLYFLNSLENHT
jgi:hypothetical protein